MTFRERFAKMTGAKQAVIKKIALLPAKDRNRLLKLEALRRGRIKRSDDSSQLESH